jgi:hypothetical protein
MGKGVYKNNQYGLLLSGIMVVSIVIILLTLTKYDDSSTTAILMGVLILILFIWLLTYKITIIVNDKFISAKFGIGFLKRKALINDIDFSTLKVITPSKFTGIGLRLTPIGWLWNVKFGKALFFKTKNGKTFFVGTDEAEKIKNILLNFK